MTHALPAGAVAHPAEELAKLRTAFEFFNVKLFGGTLPACRLTIERHPHFVAWYVPDAWETGYGDGLHRVGEIGLRANTVGWYDTKESLSSLVHEMCHHWQFTQGTTGNGRSHNTEWAVKMRAVGLYPLRADGEGGQLGRRVSHETIFGGPFDTACDELLATGFEFEWRPVRHARTQERRQVGRTSFRYVCPTCGQSARATSDVHLMCAACTQVMTPAGDAHTATHKQLRFDWSTQHD